MTRSFYRQLLGVLCSLVVSTAALAEEAWEFSERINKGTVSVISGGINGTYIRIATDLASVLDNGEDLRILAIMGKGSVQNIDDILYLRGIDIGIVQSDVLTYVKRQNKHPSIGKRVRYITKLYNEEFHLLANKSVESAADLAGKTKTERAAFVGTEIARLAKEKGVEKVSFDRGSCKYHGRVKALADAAREGGLTF